MSKEAQTMTAPKNYRVLLADDHAVVRSGLRTLLETQPGLEVCGEATTGVEALELVKKGKPDLVLLDLTMPEMNGLEAARLIQEQSPETAVLVLSMHFSEEIARDVLRSGARGYVLKSDANPELLTAVERVRQGKTFFTGRLTSSMAESFIQAASDQDGLIPGTNLTQREVEIMQLLADGKSNKEAAAALGVSTRTIESHRNHIMRKMGFSSFSDLVRFAIRNNLVSP